MSWLDRAIAYKEGQLDMLRALRGATGSEPREVALCLGSHREYAMWCLGHCIVTAANLWLAYHTGFDRLDVTGWGLGER